MPFDRGEDRLESEFAEWLSRIGAHVLTMTPEQHDTAVAWSSHLPQLLSTALGLTLSRAANPDVERVAGPGLLDMTRLAQSSPDLWQSILETNREPVLAALNALIDQLANIRTHLEEEKLVTLWRESSTFSRYLRREGN